MWVRPLGREDPLEQGMATHSSILAWRIPGQRSLVGYSPRGCKELDMTEVTAHIHAWYLTPVIPAFQIRTPPANIY